MTSIFQTSNNVTRRFTTAPITLVVANAFVFFTAANMPPTYPLWLPITVSISKNGTYCLALLNSLAYSIESIRRDIIINIEQIIVIPALYKAYILEKKAFLSLLSNSWTADSVQACVNMFWNIIKIDGIL